MLELSRRAHFSHAMIGPLFQLWNFSDSFELFSQKFRNLTSIMDQRIFLTKKTLN